MNNETEDEDFETWWIKHGKNQMPNETLIRPVDYKFYHIAAERAWEECACRKDRAIFNLELKDHEIREFVSRLVELATCYANAQSLRDVISREVNISLPQNKI